MIIIISILIRIMEEGLNKGIEKKRSRSE